MWVGINAHLFNGDLFPTGESKKSARRLGLQAAVKIHFSSVVFRVYIQTVVICELTTILFSFWLYRDLFLSGEHDQFARDVI